MSARAAWRLEALGFARVYRYAAGKADWLAAGLPTEGAEATTLRAGAVARTDVPTCSPGERADQAAGRTRRAGWDSCIVVNAQRVVVGRLRRDALDAAGEATVEQVMEEGPTTIRASEELAELVQRMRNRNVPAIVVTDPDGRLLGILQRTDAELALAGAGGGSR
jgi:CBS domain-containing protein